MSKPIKSDFLAKSVFPPKQNFLLKLQNLVFPPKSHFSSKPQNHVFSFKLENHKFMRNLKNTFSLKISILRLWRETLFCGFFARKHVLWFWSYIYLFYGFGRKTKFCDFDEKTWFVVLAEKRDVTFLTKNVNLRFWQKNDLVVLTRKSSLVDLAGKSDFAILTKKRDFAVLVEKLVFTGLVEKTWFCDPQIHCFTMHMYTFFLSCTLIQRVLNLVFYHLLKLGNPICTHMCESCWVTQYWFTSSMYIYFKKPHQITFMLYGNLRK